jgi:hypothetical protein
MKKTYTFSNENGTFICFLDYEEEDDFKTFLPFVCEKLGVAVPPTTVAPYSLIAELDYANSSLTASYNADAGCYLRISPESKLSAEAIIERCYGKAGKA